MELNLNVIASSSSSSCSCSCFLTIPPRVRHPTRPPPPSYYYTSASFPCNSLQSHLPKPLLSPLRAAVSSATEKIEASEFGFLEVGYIAKAHGLRGEVSVKPSTDFPELRFAEPGRRWLRQTAMGKEIIKEIKFVEGREHVGQKSWIVRLEGVDSIDQANQLVGSTLLVKEDDRPELEDGEFHTRDLIGIRVILKETGDCVGTVVNVFDIRGSDLLQVRLHSSTNEPDESGNPRLVGNGTSGPLVWVPFVESIVPDVDIVQREMKITPPKGLLKLNVRTDELSKKERRQLEWQERKRSQRRLITAKKILSELEQKHVFDGLRHGKKSQRSLLADQIVGVNSSLLQVALESLQFPSKRWSVAEIIDKAQKGLVKKYLEVPKSRITSSPSEESLGSNMNFVEQGLQLLSGGKVAIVLVVKNGEEEGGDISDLAVDDNRSASFLEKLLSHDQMLAKAKDRASVPLILVCQVEKMESLEMMFVENDYYGFDSEKVRFLEEEKLPVFSSGEEEDEETKHKILMKSPWEILQSPVGSGGPISTLSSSGIIEELSKTGVEYVQMCNATEECVVGGALLLGVVSAAKAEMGIQVSRAAAEESVGMVSSVEMMKILGDELQFEALARAHPHVKLVEKEWKDVVPSSSPNSYELRCSSFNSCVNSVSPRSLCVLHLTE